MKMTDSPGAITVTPVSGNAFVKLAELSSTLRPVRSTGVEPTLVTSNQSARYGEPPLPLDQGTTSVIFNAGSTIGFAIRPGEPRPWPSCAWNAPFTPTALNAAISGSGFSVAPRPAALSNVEPTVEAPTATPVTRRPAASNRLTSSPPVPRPTPVPE